MDPQPEADVQSVAATPAPGGAVTAAAQAGAMGNQAFGRALAAARGAGPDQLARFIASPTGPMLRPAASHAAQVARDLAGEPADAGGQGAQPTGGAAIDKAALASRVAGIARDALSSWAATSTIVGVRVDGASGSGGSLIGPPLIVFLLFRGSAPPAEAAVQSKALQAFGDAFQQWCAAFQVPAGTPLWPAFASVPSPVAPPTPAIPMPLTALAPAPLTLSLVGSDPSEQEALNEAATALHGAFNLWKAGRIVTRLMGSGPVPTYAPPFMPAGPVVGGTASAQPPAV